MSHYIEKVTVSLENLISELARNPSLFLKNPDTDFSRNRKINFKTCVGITMNSGGCTLNKELLDFFDFDVNAPKKNYIQMMTGKIRIAQEDYDLHMHQLEDAKSKADILFELLAYGVLDVEPDSQKAVNQSMLDTMKYIRNQYGLEILESPRRLLGLISDLAPEQFNERRKLKLLFDIGVVDQLKSNPENIERVIQMTETELGFTEEETKKYIQYLTVFMEKDSKNGVI